MKMFYVYYGESWCRDYGNVLMVRANSRKDAILSHPTAEKVVEVSL